MCDASVLLRTAFEMARGLFDIRYAIAYKLAAAEHPGLYATGPNTTLVLSAFGDRLRAKRDDVYQKNPNELWRDERMGQRRHLTGLFRGAYPASILSESHVRTADLQSRGIGRLSELDPDASLWLWELSDAEIPAAQAMLESQGVLVSQADQR